jgi:threonine/homoserine/homoserine lactone efflux protein
MLDTAFLAASSLACAAGILTPGPNFVAVSHRAISSSEKEAFAVGFGVSLVSALWAATSIFGLGAVFTAIPWTLSAVKLGGAAYLVWLGIQLMRRSRTPLARTSSCESDSSSLRAMRSGVLNNLSNPKSMTFYASVFSSTVPPGASASILLCMVIIVGAIAILWYGSVAFALSVKKASAIYLQGKSATEGVGGMFLIGFGVRQIFCGGK